MAVALRAGNSFNIYTIKVIFRSSDFMEGYSLKCQLFPPPNLCYDAAIETSIPLIVVNRDKSNYTCILSPQRDMEDNRK